MRLLFSGLTALSATGSANRFSPMLPRFGAFSIFQAVPTGRILLCLLGRAAEPVAILVDQAGVPVRLRCGLLRRRGLGASLMPVSFRICGGSGGCRCLGSLRLSCVSEPRPVDELRRSSFGRRLRFLRGLLIGFVLGFVGFGRVFLRLGRFGLGCLARAREK